MKQFILILVFCILLNLLSCLPFGLQTGFSTFSTLAEPSPVEDFPGFNQSKTRLIQFLNANCADWETQVHLYFVIAL